ncbi:DUF6207 family protein [Streptomyces sp. NPDC001480]|uniref:DUF6207 family protein n=1 Tax=Streptomyces sp. NPDC001480 TaxID=3364577 RepID=UPI0036B9FD31
MPMTPQWCRSRSRMAVARTREPGEPGVRLRCFLDLRQELALEHKQDRIRALEQQLAASGYDVKVETKWWGFQILLNAKAAQDVADIFEMIGDYASDVLGKKIGTVVEVYCKTRAALIRAVGKDYGCRLVSPWRRPVRPRSGQASAPAQRPGLDECWLGKSSQDHRVTALAWLRQEKVSQ